MRKILINYVLVIILVFIISWLWEFIIEPYFSAELFNLGSEEKAAERWEYVITATSFCLLAIIFPTIWSLRIEKEKKQLINKLQKSLDEIKTLHGIIPICSYCKQIRNDKGAWEMMEAYITAHSHAEFSHGACPDCYRKQMEEIDREEALSMEKKTKK